MNINSRELCPNCIDLTEFTEEKRIIREDELCLLERIVRYCQSCKYELSTTVTLRFKRKTG